MTHGENKPIPGHTPKHTGAERAYPVERVLPSWSLWPRRAPRAPSSADVRVDPHAV